jgi:hypothetical protein
MSLPASFFVGASNAASSVATWIGPAIQAGGAFYSASSQRSAGEAEQMAYQLRAQNVEREGAMAEEQSRSKLKRLLASQRALYAKAGVDLSSGSPLTMMVATAEEGEKEALNIRLGTREEAGMQRFVGGQALTTAKQKANTTLLSGLGSAFASYQKVK